MNFELLGSDGSTVKASSGTTFGSSGSLIKIPAGTAWFQQTYTFTNYGSGVQYVSFGLGGRDQSGWGGYYGTDFDDASVTVNTNSAPNVPDGLGDSSLVNGGWINGNQPSFNFNLSDPNSGDTVQYEIQVATTSDFSSPVVDYTSALAAQGPSGFTVGQVAGGGTYAADSSGQTLADGPYYWRVRAIDNSGADSAYAAANGGLVAFKVDATAPSRPGQPTAASPTKNTEPTLSWTASTDSGSGLGGMLYNLQWSQSPTFASGVYSAAVGANSYIMALPLSAGTWYFRVSASDQAGNNSSYSPTGTVIIDLTPPFITLNGSSSMSVNQGSNFVDPGATATDNVDGNLTGSIVISGTVDTSRAGTYALIYTVTDAAGNSASVTRTVAVKAPAVIAESVATPNPATPPQPPVVPTAVAQTPILLNNYPEYFASQGETVSLPPAGKAYFELNQNGQVVKHTITVASVNNGAVTLTIASKPLNVTMTIGETRLVDVNRDGIPDISIKLLGVVNGLAQVAVHQLPQPVKKVAVAVKRSDAWSALYSAIAVAVMLVAIFGLRHCYRHSQ